MEEEESALGCHHSPLPTQLIPGVILDFLDVFPVPAFLHNCLDIALRIGYVGTAPSKVVVSVCLSVVPRGNDVGDL